MLPAFFSLAMTAPSRQRAFRALVLAHLAAMAVALVPMHWGAVRTPLLFGNLLLIAGIVEGALLVGWRLTQLPKSQALEFLLVSPLRPPLVLLAEALVGLARLALVTLAGLPILVLMVTQGMLYLDDLPVLLVVPWVWGAVTGLGLTTWAYEPDGVRRWGERVVVAGILVYLVVGVLAGEHLPVWLDGLPAGMSRVIIDLVRGFHEYNPFGVMKFAMENSSSWAWERSCWVAGLGLLLAGGLLLRSAFRLQGHFQDEHYRPVVARKNERRAPVGEQPLAWWAVKRVSRYSGRINLYLAGGFGVVYAAYIVYEPVWPAWLGRQVFLIFEGIGGLPMLATALVLLASVPAAFQYGLWDSNDQDRCRRLELLLLTQLDGSAYWQAAATAAWRRGRGYFAVAGLLWAAALISGRASWEQVLAGIAAGVVLWGLYFAVGFRAFARGVQAGNLGMVLTLLVPLAVVLAAQAGWPGLAQLLPPGSVYFGTTQAPGLAWVIGPLLAGAMALFLARQSLRRCEADLRRWLDRNGGCVS